jgi:hypothetical protein
MLFCGFIVMLCGLPSVAMVCSTVADLIPFDHSKAALRSFIQLVLQCVVQSWQCNDYHPKKKCHSWSEEPDRLGTKSIQAQVVKHATT